MLQPRVGGRGRGRASRPGWTWRVRLQPVRASRGRGRRGGGGGGPSFSLKGTESGGRRGGVLFLSLSPFLCRYSKSAFAPPTSGALPASCSPPYPLCLHVLFPYPLWCSCRWSLEEFDRHRQKSGGGTRNSRNAGCARRHRARPLNSCSDTHPAPPSPPPPAQEIRGDSSAGSNSVW